MSQATVESVDEYLSNVYYNPKRPGSFGGAESLYRDVKDEGRFKLSREKISNWLMKQDTYILYMLQLADILKEIVSLLVVLMKNGNSIWQTCSR